MNYIIIIIISAILFISSIIGLIIGIIKLKQTGKILSKYTDENPKPTYYDDKIYLDIESKWKSFLFLILGMLFSIIATMTGLVYSIDKYKKYNYF